MSLLTIVFAIAIAVFVVTFLQSRANKLDDSQFEKQAGFIKSLGLLGLVLGMLGQFIGLFMAFEVVSVSPDISPAIMAGGVKVSMITSIYGMIIFVISYMLWFLINFLKK